MIETFVDNRLYGRFKIVSSIQHELGEDKCFCMIKISQEHTKDIVKPYVQELYIPEKEQAQKIARNINDICGVNATFNLNNKIRVKIIHEVSFLHFYKEQRKEELEFHNNDVKDLFRAIREDKIQGEYLVMTVWDFFNLVGPKLYNGSDLDKILSYEIEII